MTTTNRTNQEQRQQIAATILDQLGGQKTIAMCGLKNFVHGEENENVFIMFKMMRNPSKANWCRITLNAMDTYDMKFTRVHGMKHTTIEEVSGIYDDMLISSFENVTKLDTRIN